MADTTFVDRDLSPGNRVVAAWLNDVNNLRYGAGNAARGADLLQFIQAGSSAGIRTVQAKERDIVSVKDFYLAGQTPGDGVIDDSIAWNKAFAAAMGGTVLIPPPAVNYLLLHPLNLTTAPGIACKGIIIKYEGGIDVSGATTPIVAKHLGHVFDCTGSADIVFENINVYGSPVTTPLTMVWNARNSSNDSVGRLRFINPRSSGKFSAAVICLYGSEENEIIAPHLYNDYTAAAGKVLCFTGNNILGLSSTFTTVTTGSHSTLINNIWGGSLALQSSHVNADVIYIEAASAVRCFGTWMFCATGAAAGRSLVTVDLLNATSDNCSFIGCSGENASFNPSYAIFFSNVARTPTGWKISEFRASVATRLLYAGALVTLDNFSIDRFDVLTGNSGIEAAGALTNSTVFHNGVMVLTSSSFNFLFGDASNWTITNRTKDQWLDLNTGCSNGNGYKFTGVASADTRTLDDYDEYTAASANCTGAVTAAAIWKLTLVGKVVTLVLPPVQSNGVAVSSFSFGTAIPAKYRPAVSTAFVTAPLVDNAAQQSAPGAILINSSNGVIDVYKNGSFAGNFTVTATAGLNYATAVSWTI